MRKLKIIEHTSLDGVIQTTSGPEDDFPNGDWTAPYRSPAGLQIVNEMYGKTCDVLFGRRTYDLLASFWPKAPKSPMADRLNAATKYVVTHRPASLEWGPFEAIGSDLVDSVRRIKARNGPDLVVAGSSTLTSVLLDHGLADEGVLLVNPIVLGKGKRFFEGGSLPRGFALGSTRALPSGILVNVYKLIPTLAEEAVSHAKLEREFEIAREVQERLFPQAFPNVAGVEIAAHCRPAQAVGGDYYDLIDIRDGSLAEAGHAPGENISSASGTTARGGVRLGIAIGDISGKGMSAALLMASLHASLRSQVLSGGGDLGTKDGQCQPPSLRRVRLQPLCHVLLRRTGLRLAHVALRQWRTQSSCGAAQRRRRLAGVSPGRRRPRHRAACRSGLQGADAPPTPRG